MSRRGQYTIEDNTLEYNDYFHFTALEDGNLEFRFYMNTTATTSSTLPIGLDFEYFIYRIDGSYSVMYDLTFAQGSSGYTPASDNTSELILYTAPVLEGDIIYIFGSNSNFSDGTTYDTKFFHFSSGSSSNHTKFTVGGKLMDLLNNRGSNLAIPSNVRVFYELFGRFYGLVDAYNLNLNATNTYTRCYESMFSACSNLIRGPKSLNLTSATAQVAYGYMFNSCTSLLIAPQLPATSIGTYGYTNMFNGCTSLKIAPDILVTYLPSNACINMFRGCSSLESISVNFTSWSNATSEWVTGVSSSGVFTCPDSLPHTSTHFGANKIPTGWSVLTFL